MPYAFEFARAVLTVDVVVFSLDREGLQVMLIERDLVPFAGRRALPGGFVRVDETLDGAARRELREETGLRDIYPERLDTFGELDRDPRERVVTVACYALVSLEGHEICANTDARDAAWFPVGKLPRLAFDHRRILAAAYDRLRAKVRSPPIGFELLPERFTLRQLQRLNDVILDRTLDKCNFPKKVLAAGVAMETAEIEQDVAHRATQFYRFDKRTYDRRTGQGFYFEA